MPIFIGDTFVYSLITIAISFILTFALTWSFGIDESIGEETKKKQVFSKAIDIKSPLNGEVVPLEKVKDYTFASKVLGSGIAILPTENKIYAPADGIITSFHKSKHAIGITTFDNVRNIDTCGNRYSQIGRSIFYRLC